MKFSTTGGSSRRIKAKVGSKTRPTTAKVRKAIFDTLYARFDFENSAVLDLFAGTGALGFEAASRGAKRVVFVENDFLAATAIKENILNFTRGTTEQISMQVVRRDVLKYIQDADLLGNRMDICFCDPPYDFSSWERLLSYKPATFVVAESDKEVHPTDAYEIVTIKRYGGTVVTFMRRFQSQLEQDFLSEVN